MVFFQKSAIDELDKFLKKDSIKSNKTVRLCYRNDTNNLSVTKKSSSNTIVIDGHPVYWNSNWYLDKINNTTSTGGFKKAYHDKEYKGATLILLDPFLADNYQSVTFGKKIIYTGLAAKRWCREELKAANAIWAVTNHGMKEVDIITLIKRVNGIEKDMGTKNITPPAEYLRTT